MCCSLKLIVAGVLLVRLCASSQMASAVADEKPAAKEKKPATTEKKPTATEKKATKPEEKPKPVTREYVSGKKWAEPKIVDPGDASKAPSDAIVLFDGKDLAKEFNGGEDWTVSDGI